ncbi:LPS export ABC transporter permease LptF [Pseudomaricurvus sp. HS19]|uniref:LPS export ABC transporter permease LptF n=1 Tax=Pseudomaricurvus sp. HS19 TaxID=2692626 RepID=UPI001368C3BA|nr:LPS export ABC transporter permease LptF [Pseudomaricurvus sp. HS19]MYM62985.1 LPS export ABC transporter permease LptF [Pseudomaricurvus sp. HS19]
MIIFRYLAREVLVSMFAVSGVLLLIIMSGRFVKYLADAAAGKLDPGVLFAIIGFRLPGFLELILPLGLFIAFLLAYGRLYMESEMVVLSACGMSPRRLMYYSLSLALVVALLVASLSLVISPLGVARAEAIFLQQSQRSEFDHLTPARFQKTQGGASVTYADELSSDRKQMLKVFIAEMDTAEEGEAIDLAVIRAASGEQVIDEATGQRYLQLTDGYRYSGQPGDADYRVVHFDHYRQLLEVNSKSSKRSKRADSRPTRELLTADDSEGVAALHWRLSLPVLVVVVTLLAVPLSKTNPRQGRYVQMIPAILIYIIYLVSLNAARGAVEESDASPWSSIWLVHVVALVLASALWLWPSVKRRLRARRLQELSHA